MSDDPTPGSRPRRAILTGAGTAGVTAALVGCQTYSEPSTPVAESPGGAAPEQAGAASGGSADDAAPDRATEVLAAVSDIPVGGGKIFAAEQVVVTQPTEGTIRAFSARCTHQGCTVSSVKDRSIVCGCHNSSFDIADGSVKGGPASRPLPAAAVTVDGESIRLT